MWQSVIAIDKVRICFISKVAKRQFLHFLHMYQLVPLPKTLGQSYLKTDISRLTLHLIIKLESNAQIFLAEGCLCPGAQM